MNKEQSPFSPGKPVPVDYFTGRLKEIQRLETAIRQTASGRNENVFVTGERGIGKSSLASFARFVAQRDYQFIGAHCLLGAEKSVEGICRFVFQRLLQELPEKSLFEKAKTVFEKYIGSVSLLGISVEFTKEPSALEGLRQDFVPKLRSLFHTIQDAKKGIVLILDDLNGVAKIPDFAYFLKSLVDELATSAQPPLPLLLMLIGISERMTDLAKVQPSVGRIFNVIELTPMNPEESSEFFRKTFGSVGIPVEEEALALLVRYSGGFPMLMHEVGDATFWFNEDDRIDQHDAVGGLMQAAENVGRRYLEPQVYESIRSQAYLSVLRRIAKMPRQTEIKRSEILPLIPEHERRKFDNFLQRMQTLGILKPGEERGEYVFVSELHRLYIWLEARRAEEKAEKR